MVKSKAKKSLSLSFILIFCVLTLSSISGFASACVCGNGVFEDGEECDWGTLNGFLCWADYGSSCTYCSTSCMNKTITNYCGDGIKQDCEECDDGNSIDTDNCSNTCKINHPEPYCGDKICNNGETCSSCAGDCGICPPPTCDHDISVRYSYSNSFGKGIAVGYENGTWIAGDIVNLEKGIYKIKYFIDNNKEDDDNVSVLLKLDNTILLEYYQLINIYSSKEFDLNTSSLCNSSHTLTLEIESDGNECNLSDNHASRQIYVKCNLEPPTQPYCGDNQCNNNENCSTCSHDCGTCPPPQPYCGDNQCNNNENCSTCSHDCGTCPPVCPTCGNCGCNEECTPSHCGNGIIEGNEQCDDSNLISGDGCSRLCYKEKSKEEECTKKANHYTEFCESDWVCSGWGECVNSAMTRKCVDRNSCGEEYGKPYEQTGCTEKVLSSSPNGVVLKSYSEENTSKTMFFFIVVGIILLVILLVILVNLIR
jgi:cysteine-rich repeat protein